MEEAYVVPQERVGEGSVAAGFGRVRHCTLTNDPALRVSICTLQRKGRCGHSEGPCLRAVDWVQQGSSGRQSCACWAIKALASHGLQPGTSVTVQAPRAASGKSMLEHGGLLTGLHTHGFLLLVQSPACLWKGIIVNLLLYKKKCKLISSKDLPKITSLVMAKLGLELSLLALNLVNEWWKEAVGC